MAERVIRRVPLFHMHVHADRADKRTVSGADGIKRAVDDAIVLIGAWYRIDRSDVELGRLGTFDSV